MGILQQIIFNTCRRLFYFVQKGKEIYQNIMMGQKETINSDKAFRLKRHYLFAFGRQKMFKTTCSCINTFGHLCFICNYTNRAIEIIIDGFWARINILFFSLLKVFPWRFIYVCG
ncbi:MAG: hypothetical protein IPO64_12890 [Bacteroidetes bacterium]|nr:hypothetical protein [Bacteroidota bacterium]